MCTKFLLNIFNGDIYTHIHAEICVCRNVYVSYRSLDWIGGGGHGLTALVRVCFGFKPYTANNVKGQLCRADLCMTITYESSREKAVVSIHILCPSICSSCGFRASSSLEGPVLICPGHTTCSHISFCFVLRELADNKESYFCLYLADRN